MTKKMCLVILQGQGDTDIRLANAAANEWFDQPFEQDEEQIPPAVLEGHKVKNETIEVTPGSCDNDRAIQCPGIAFSSLVDVFKYCKENDIEISDEYHGCIY